MSETGSWVEVPKPSWSSGATKYQFPFDGDKLETPNAISIQDSARFGITTYRIQPDTQAALREHEDAFVIARIDADRLGLVQYALKHGFILCDTLTYWRGSVNIEHKPVATGYWARPREAKDAEAIARLTAAAFSDYQGHYHADPRTRDKAVACYVEWAGNFDGPGLVIEHEKWEFPYLHRKVIAYGLFGLPCELTLAAVSGEHQGKGLYADLVRACAAWGQENGAGEITISTQVTNLAVQKVWARLGLTPYKHVYTLHRWPD